MSPPHIPHVLWGLLLLLQAAGADSLDLAKTGVKTAPRSSRVEGGIPEGPTGSGQLQVSSPGELCPSPAQQHHPPQELPGRATGTSRKGTCVIRSCPGPVVIPAGILDPSPPCGRAQLKAEGRKVPAQLSITPNSHPASNPPSKSSSPKIQEVYGGEEPSAPKGPENAFGRKRGLGFEQVGWDLGQAGLMEGVPMAVPRLEIQTILGFYDLLPVPDLL